MAIAALMVEVGANVARLQRDMNRVTGIVEGAGRRMSSIFRGVGVALAGAFSVRAIQGSINEVLKMADSTAKLSQSVGVSVEVLSSFRHAADLSGTSIDTVGRSLGILSKNMMETSRGTGTAQRGFDALGITVTNADKTLRASDEVLGDIADRFASMEDGAAKTALAMELFGKSGRDMIPMLNQGRAGIQQMREEAEKLGLVMSEAMAKQAERVRDNFTRLRGVSEGLKIQLATGLLDSLEKISDVMFDLAQDTGDLEDAIWALDTSLKVLATGALVVLGVISTLRGGFKQLNRELESATGEKPKWYSWFGPSGFSSNLSKMLFQEKPIGSTFSMEEAIAPIQRMLERIDKIWAETETDTKERIRRMREEFNTLSETGGGAAALAKPLADQQAALALALGLPAPGEISQATRELADQIYNSLAQETHRLRMAGHAEDERFRQMQEASILNSLKVLEDKKVEVVQTWRDGAKAAITDYATHATNSFKQAQDAFTNGFKRMEDALVDFVMTGKFQFRDFAESIIRDLARIAIQQNIVGPLASGLGSIFGMKFHSGGVVGTDGAAAIAPAAMFAGAPRFHSGLAPDEYPAILQRGEGVFTQAQMRALGGGGNITVNVIEAPGRGGQQQQRQGNDGGNIIDVFVEQIKGAIANDVARGRGAIPMALSRTYGLNRAAGAY